MEVKRGEIPQEKWDEMKQIVRDYLCAECGGELTIHTNPEKATLEASCINREHHGWVERKTWQQSYRRGEIVPVAEMTKDIMPRAELGRAMNLLALRYPDAIIDQATASLFIRDCARLDLDPLMSPAEAVPVPFKGAKKKTVAMVITVDGWLSMAARGCPERWGGAPSIERVDDKDLAESLCRDPDAWLYKVAGRTKDMEPGQMSSAYGWYTHKEWDKIKNTTLPAATQPGNQAATRGIKKWVRQNFPECRQRMKELTAEWLKRAEGIKAAEEYIDAEYSFISLPEGGGETGGPQATEKETAKKKVSEPASPPLKDGESQKIGVSAAEEETFTIDLEWLKESLKELKWTDDTCKTWLVSQYKVSPQGTLEDVINHLTREQAGEFVQTIQEKVSQKQGEFWG